MRLVAFLFTGKNGEEENNFQKCLTPNLTAAQGPISAANLATKIS